MPGKKSVLWAYILWLFGGLFGVHHFYLRRDRHALVRWTTLGGFVVGWMAEIYCILRYVIDANEDPRHVQELMTKMNSSKTPPFSIIRFTGMVMVSYYWGKMMMYAVPPDKLWGINLIQLTPLVVAVGVWSVGNIGRDQGTLKWALLASYATYQVRYYVYDETMWFALMVFTSALAFDLFSKEWRRTPPARRQHVAKRVAVLVFCACLYLSLWFSFIYFYIQHLMEQFLIYMLQHIMHHVWNEVRIDVFFDRGQNAHKILGVGPDASQQEITSSWRRLSLEHHPDKFKDPVQRRAAQERFIEIQEAYETLSNSKHRRKKRNIKDNSEPSTKREDL